MKFSIFNFQFSNKRVVLGGQAVIIVLLIMVIALTIGLSISSRSIRDIRVETRTEESQRAFSAAEAGLEKALLLGDTIGRTTVSNGVTYEVNVENAGGGAEFVFPQSIAKDDTQQLWLVSHDTSGSLVCTVDLPCYTKDKIFIYWGNDTSGAPSSSSPALEVGIIYKEGGIYKIKRYAYDPYGVRRSSNKFLDPSLAGSPFTVGGSKLEFGVEQTLPKNILEGGTVEEVTALRLRLLYNTNQQLVAAKGDGQDIPVQGKTYDAKGHAEVAGGSESEVRRISFFKSFPSLPGIFDFVLYSGSDLNKP